MRDHEVAMCAYLQLAVLSNQRHQVPARDRFLFLGGIEACRAGWLDVAEVCRQKIAQSNPAHQLNQFASFPDALRDSDFQLLATRWERYCPFEQAEHLLRQLGRKPEGEATELSRGSEMMKLLNDAEFGSSLGSE